MYFFAFLIANLSLMPGPFIPNHTECYDNTFCIESETKGDRVDIFVRSLVPWEVTMTLDVSAKNMKSNVALPFTSSIKGKTKTKAVTLSIDQPEESWSFSFIVNWVLGDFKAEHQRGFAYTLPYSTGDEHLVGQGYLGNFTHQGKYAIDWDMPEGTEIRAARSGTVVDLAEHFRRGGPDPDLATMANFIKIRHSDGTIGNYVHLTYNGARVNLGDMVRTGDLIGYSGNTGYSSGPHLHFEVYSATRELGQRTIPVEFNTSHWGATRLKEGLYYRR